MIEVKWTDLKTAVNTRGLVSTMQYIELPGAYLVYAADDWFHMYCDINKAATAPAGSDQEDFEDNFKANCNQKQDKASAIQNAIPVVSYKSEESSLHKVTHDFCNKTTWWQESTEVTGETLTLDTGTTYEAVNTHWIDVVNGVTTRQDLKQSYKPVIYDNGVEVADTDYTIDHAAGKVTFNSAPTGPVTADYWKANGSTFTVEPDANTLLLIEHSEIQFSDDVAINTPLRFEIWVYNPLDLPNKVMYQAVQYSSMKDFVNEANLGTGVIKKLGDLPSDILVFPFNYGSIKPLQSSVGAELRVFSVEDLELTGSYGTATFYALSRNES